MEIEEISISELVPFAGNAKKHTGANIAAIQESIRQFGFREPVIAWHDEEGNAVIVAGHGRVEAAKGIGLHSVPVVFADELTDEQRRMLTLADNQTTLMTGFEWTALQDELDFLGDYFDLESFGFTALDDVDIDSMFADAETEAESVDESEAPKTATCPHCGEVFEL